MTFIKGVSNFILTLVISALLFVSLIYGILNHTIFSVEANEAMIESTDFTEEATDFLLARYSMKLESISIEEGMMYDFVEASGMGVLNYVFMETETLPEVDVTFLKEYVDRQVKEEISRNLVENTDLDQMIEYLRAVPEGESITQALEVYVSEKNQDIYKNEIEIAARIFIENKELDNEAIKEKMLEALSKEFVDTSTMKETLSLQQFFDRIMNKNPLTILRNAYDVIHTNIRTYIPWVMILLILIMACIEFKLSNSISWFIIFILIPLVPLQALRLLRFFIERDFVDLINGMDSYKDYMLDAMINRLNFYTIVGIIVIILLIIGKKLLQKYVDEKVALKVEKQERAWLLIRIGVVGILFLILGFIGNKAQDKNLNFYEDIQALQPSDFDVRSIDEVLSDLLNVDYDF